MCFKTLFGSAALRKLILGELTIDQRKAIAAPFEEALAIVGAPATGKSTALAQRAARLIQEYPGAEPLILRMDHGIDSFAVDVLRSEGKEPSLLDDVAAELMFAAACEPLFSLEWEEFARSQLDPEVPALRSPQRFLRSAFRLIRRLRDADVAPTFFLERALRGATEFYAKPPNLANPTLLSATKSSYHDSLEAGAKELLRQHRREIDLAKIITKLYERYIALVTSTGGMTGRDAVIAAADLLEMRGGLRAAIRQRHPFAFIDDAQQLTKAELRLLSAIYGEHLRGVTLCGDPSSSVSAVRMTNPHATFKRAQAQVELREPLRRPRVERTRLSTVREEAMAIAQRVTGWLSQGSAPDRIALIFRSVRHVAMYEAALLDSNIPALIAGDVNIFADRRTLDALAILWSVYDPFRHDWLLRALANPAWRLSDASLAILCSEPPDPQRQLFAFDEEPPPTARASRWDPKRDLRLGWNVIRGDRDDALGSQAAARVAQFRRLRESWVSLMHDAPFETFARAVWRDGLAREGSAGCAHARAQQLLLRRLLERLKDFVARDRGATPGDVLRYAEQRMHSDLETCSCVEAPGCVRILSVEAARGLEFDHVIVAGVRPGSFPCYYSPEAFLFSPHYGMIPKENVGDAQASRTAKFTYYMFASKAPQHYYERERHAFAYAISRARNSVLATASGTPIRSATAPEFLEELRASA